MSGCYRARIIVLWCMYQADILLILAGPIRLSICHMTESACVEFKCSSAFSVLETL